MARLIVFALLLANAGFAAWLWQSRPPPPTDPSGREVNPEAVRIVSVVPPSESANRQADRRRQAGALSGPGCVALTGVAADQREGVREAIAGLALGDRVREQTGAGAREGFIFREPDPALLAWLSRLQRGLDAARIEPAPCPDAPATPPPAPPVAPTPPAGRR